MTNVRVTVEQAAEWRFCPYCGRSEDAGFDFAHSLSHCGYHIRLWEAASDAEVGIE